MRNLLLAVLGLQGIMAAAAQTTTISATKHLRSKDPSQTPTPAPTLQPTVSFTPPPTRPANPKQVATIDAKTSQEVTARINKARRSQQASDMQLLTWDPTFSAELKSFTMTIDPAWFFEDSGLPGPAGKGTNSFNGFHLTELPQFQNFGYNFLIHDTCTDPKKFLAIIKYRLNQAHCIDFAKCDATEFTNFETCGDPLVLAPEKPCSWATQYYPRLMINSLNKVGCVLFKEHGPSAPAGQGWSFWCYGNYQSLTNDIPFTPGKKCSACPAEAPRCADELCAPALSM